MSENKDAVRLACDYCHGVGACPKCWGRAAIEELKAEIAALRTQAAAGRDVFEAGFWAGRGKARNTLEAWHAYTGQEPPTLEQYHEDVARRFGATPAPVTGQTSGCGCSKYAKCYAHALDVSRVTGQEEA